MADASQHEPCGAASQLAIVVVSYGSSALLESNLAPIDRRTLPSSRVVVVDNRTTDGEREVVARLCEAHSWELLTPDANVGFGAGMNLGVAHAIDLGCTAFLLLNPDVSIDGPAIAALVQVAEERTPTMVSPRLDRADGSTWFAGGQLDPRSGLTRSRPDHLQQGPDRWLTGACLLVDRTAWDLSGGFDERYFLYWEDVDLSRRVLDNGGGLHVAHEVVAVHSVGATQGSGGKSATYCRYMCRNRLLYSTDHVPALRRLRWLWHAPRYAARVLLREGRVAALRRPSRAAAACWGTLSGVALVIRSLVRDAGRVAAGRSG